MKPAPEEDFSRLQKLLALKRHEQPPPGYFDRLPGQVTARIRAEAAAHPEPWWRQLLAGFHTKPAWSIAFSVLVLGALATGVWLAPRMQQDGDLGTATIAISAGVTDDLGSGSTNVALQLPLENPATPSNSAAPPGLFTPGGQVDRVKFK